MFSSSFELCGGWPRLLGFCEVIWFGFCGLNWWCCCCLWWYLLLLCLWSQGWHFGAHKAHGCVLCVCWPSEVMMIMWCFVLFMLFLMLILLLFVFVVMVWFMVNHWWFLSCWPAALVWLMPWLLLCDMVRMLWLMGGNTDGYNLVLWEWWWCGC